MPVTIILELDNEVFAKLVEIAEEEQITIPEIIVKAIYMEVFRYELSKILRQQTGVESITEIR